jgi:hypothetical protein
MDTLFGVRRLKYRHLHHLIGREVTIPSVDQIESSIRAAILPDVLGDFRLQDSTDNLSLVMSKYGFLDLVLVTHESLLNPTDKINQAAIRELGFSPRPEDPARDMDPAIKNQMGNDRACLEVLTEDTREQGCFLRLFLNSKWSQNSVMRFAKQMAEEQSHGVPGESVTEAAALTLTRKMREWFPIVFTVEDACLSNSESIWVAKHGYL